MGERDEGRVDKDTVRERNDIRIADSHLWGRGRRDRGEDKEDEGTCTTNTGHSDIAVWCVIITSIKITKHVLPTTLLQHVSVEAIVG